MDQTPLPAGGGDVLTGRKRPPREEGGREAGRDREGQNRMVKRREKVETRVSHPSKVTFVAALECAEAMFRHTAVSGDKKQGLKECRKVQQLVSVLRKGAALTRHVDRERLLL